MTSPLNKAAGAAWGGARIAHRQRIRQVLTLVRPLGWAAALACLAVLASYAAGFERGYRPWPDGPGTSPLTAVTLLLLATGLTAHRPLRRTNAELVPIAIGIAILRMAEISFDFSLLPGTTYLLHPGASPIGFGWNSALGAALSGIAILSIGRMRTSATQVLAALALASPLVAVVGYSYGLTAFYSRTSPYTATILFLIATGALFATSRNGVIRLLFAPTIAGQLARIQLLSAIAIPYVIGYLLLRTFAEGAASVVGIGVIVTAGLRCTLMSVSLLALDRMDRRRRRAERAAYYDATHDHLTGLANRRMFAEVAELDLTRAARHGSPICLVMMDVDRFKKVNDEFGHPAGDAVLRGTAAAITRNLRAGDLAARLGGEEFAVLLPDTTVDEALELSERLRRAVEDADFSAAVGPRRPITISAGVAGQNPNHHGVTALLQAADAALYTAKANGRNRVELAGAA